MSDQIEITQNAVVGPDDRVILSVPVLTHEQATMISEQLRRVFGEDRSILIVGDTVHISIVKPRLPEIAE